MMAGVLVFLPIFVTYFIFAFFYDFVSSLLDPIIAGSTFTTPRVLTGPTLWKWQ